MKYENYFSQLQKNMKQLSEFIFCVALFISAVLEREEVDGAKANQKACNTYTVQQGKATKKLFQVISSIYIAFIFLKILKETPAIA